MHNRNNKVWNTSFGNQQSVELVFNAGTTHVRIPSATAAPRFPVSNDYCLVIDSSHGVRPTEDTTVYCSVLHAYAYG